MPNLLRLGGARLHIRLIDLHHISTGSEQILDFLIDCRRIIHREFDLVLVEVVLCLLCHCESAGHSYFDFALSILAQEREISDLYRISSANLAHHPRNRIGMSAAVQRRSRIVDVDAFKSSREAVRVALSAHLAVGNEIEARALLISDRKYRGVILRFFQKLRRNAPKLFGANSRWEATSKLGAIDQPVRLRIASNK